MFKRMVLASATAVVLAASGLLAHTFTPETGGFVGKGEVQTVFGLNNAAMQLVHESVLFDYDLSATYAFECEWWTGPDHNRKHHTNTKIQSVGVQSAVASDSRRTGQFTGWFLDPIAVTGGSAGEPTNADCGAEGNEMKSIVPGSVQLLSGGGGGLYATINGDRRLIP